MTTEQEIHAWLAGYPRNWDQLCQALMWRLANEFGTVVSTPPSASAAYRTEHAAGRIRQGTPPPGSFVYFDIGVDGHVGFVMNGGRVLMATSHLAEEWVRQDAGWNTVNAYAAAVGAAVLGWSPLNGGNRVPFTPDASTAGGGSTPITGATSTGETIMRYLAQTGSKDGVVRAKDSFVQGPEGPLRLIGADELEAYEYNDLNGAKTPFAEWPGEKIRRVITQAGLRVYDGNGRPTGKVRY